MIIRYCSSATLEELKSYKQVLIGKFWLKNDGHNLYQGEFGRKQKIGDKLQDVFKVCEIHPGDKTFLKVNGNKRTRRDPDLLLYIENVKSELAV